MRKSRNRRTLMRAAELETEAGYEAFLRTVGESMRRARRRAGLTLEKLAERTGLTLRMVQYCEEGRRAPSLRTLWRLGRAIGVAPKKFLP